MKGQPRIKKFLTALGMLFLLCGVAFNAVAAELFFKMAEEELPSHPASIADREFSQLVESKTRGTVLIDVFSGGVLGDEAKVLQALQEGTIDFARVRAQSLGAFAKNFEALSLPYLFANDTHLWNVLEGPVGTGLLAELADSKIVGLGFYDAGTVNFYASQKTLEKPQDMAGIKVAPFPAPFAEDFIQALGAKSVPTPDTEVYIALHGNELDAAEDTFEGFLLRAHYDVAKRICLDAHRRNIDVLVASKASWDKISAADQKTIKALIPHVVSVQKNAWQDKEKADKEELKRKKINFTVPEDIGQWEQAAQKVYEANKEKLGAFIEAVKAVQ